MGVQDSSSRGSAGQDDEPFGGVRLKWESSWSVRGVAKSSGATKDWLCCRNWRMGKGWRRSNVRGTVMSFGRAFTLLVQPCGRDPVTSVAAHFVWTSSPHRLHYQASLQCVNIIPTETIRTFISVSLYTHAFRCIDHHVSLKTERSIHAHGGKGEELDLL